jgi:hypothetical protein
MGITFGVQANVDPKRLHQNMLASIAQEFGALADEGIKFLEKKIKDWVNKTKFRKEVSVKSGKWRFSILHNASTKEGKIFDYVNLGTPGPYPIVAKNAPKLAFTVPNMPKTLAPGQTRVTGPKMSVFKDAVIHPGIKAREWDIELKEIYAANIVPRTRLAARRGLARR